MMKKLFKIYNTLNDKIQENEIKEISIKQSQIQFTFITGNILSLRDILALESKAKYAQATDITVFQESLILTFRELENVHENIEKTDNIFGTFTKLITDLAEAVCTCPNLEVTISENYIKFYIDKPNMELDALQQVDKLLNAKSQLELNCSRPYLLYIKDYED